jgi:hypothetical protein
MVNLEVPHFSTAAPLSATRRTFQPPFTTAKAVTRMHEELAGRGWPVSKK